MKQKKILGFWAGTQAYYAEMLRKQLAQLERRMVVLEVRKRLAGKIGKMGTDGTFPSFPK